MTEEKKFIMFVQLFKEEKIEYQPQWKKLRKKLRINSGKLK
jgi:hypothetical protein